LFVRAKVSRVVNAPTSTDLTPCAVIFFVPKGTNHSSSTAFLEILPDVLSFFRHSCFFKSQFLMPFFPLGFARHLFLKFSPF
jgi:hypothetical protein